MMTAASTLAELSRHQRLQRLGDLHVLLIAALVSIELLPLDRIQLRADERGAAGRRELVLDFGRLQLELGVVRTLPGQPVRGPLSMGSLERILAEWEHRAGFAIEQGELTRSDPPRHPRERLPREQCLR